MAGGNRITSHRVIVHMRCTAPHTGVAGGTQTATACTVPAKASAVGGRIEAAQDRLWQQTSTRQHSHPRTCTRAAHPTAPRRTGAMGIVVTPVEVVSASRVVDDFTSMARARCNDADELLPSSSVLGASDLAGARDPWLDRGLRTLAELVSCKVAW